MNRKQKIVPWDSLNLANGETSTTLHLKLDQWYRDDVNKEFVQVIKINTVTIVILVLRDGADGIGGRHERRDKYEAKLNWGYFTEAEKP